MNLSSLLPYLETFWQTAVIPTLKDYIEIPCKSPLFDSQWHQHGYIHQAMDLITNWLNQNAPKQMKFKVLEHPSRTPTLFIDIPGQKAGTVLLYGHIDKQPEMVGWDPDLAPWKAVIKNNRLYGRGGADDGYSVFSAITAILALQQQNIHHPRCIILIEASEESGSHDLPFYMEELAPEIGSPDVVIGLDSGCGNYDQLWSTTSLRGIVLGDLTIDIMKDGIHSGFGGGIVPSTFQILRQLLSRIEDEKTGEIIPKEFFVAIPPERQEEAIRAASILDYKTIANSYSLIDKTLLRSCSPHDLLLKRTWLPSLAITGISGLPPIDNAGNVLIPHLTVRISLRIPPTLNAKQAQNYLKNLLENDPPYHAKIHFHSGHAADGWHAPLLEDWLKKAMNDASLRHFQRPNMFLGEGGTIPFMAMLGKQFPQAQFLITGVLGPHSNAHGPNEFLDIPYAIKLTACVAEILARLEKR